MQIIAAAAAEPGNFQPVASRVQAARNKTTAKVYPTLAFFVNIGRFIVHSNLTPHITGAGQ